MAAAICLSSRFQSQAVPEYKDSSEISRSLGDPPKRFSAMYLVDSIRRILHDANVGRTILELHVVRLQRLRMCSSVVAYGYFLSKPIVQINGSTRGSSVP
jgi:hypothetical protein